LWEIQKTEVADNYVGMKAQDDGVKTIKNIQHRVYGIPYFPISMAVCACEFANAGYIWSFNDSKVKAWGACDSCELADMVKMCTRTMSS
jgi:hypothetical protein